MKETGSAGCKRRIKQFLCAPILGLLCAAAIKAQEAHQHDHELGKVNFTISCSVSAQKQFNRAVSWLHSFEYEEAEKAFAQVTFTDQKCGDGLLGNRDEPVPSYLGAANTRGIEEGKGRHRKGQVRRCAYGA